MNKQTEPNRTEPNRTEPNIRIFFNRMKLLDKVKRQKKLNHFTIFKGYQVNIHFLFKTHKVPAHSAWAVKTPIVSLQRGKTPPLRPNKCPGHDTKQFHEKATVLELWGMWSTLSFPLLPGPLPSEW